MTETSRPYTKNLTGSDGLNICQDLGPADPLRRTVRRRAKLVRQRITSLNRLTALLELLGPGYNEAFSGPGH